MKHVLAFCLIIVINQSTIKAQPFVFTEIISTLGLEGVFSDYFKWHNGNVTNEAKSYVGLTAIYRVATPFVFGIIDSDEPYINVGGKVLTDT